MNINVFRKIRQATLDGVRYYSLLDVCKVIGHKNNGFGHGFTRKKNVPMPRVKLSATDWIGLMLFLEDRLSQKSTELLEVMKFDTEANAPNFRKPRKPKPVQSTEMAVRAPANFPVAASFPVPVQVPKPAPSGEMSKLIQNMFEGHEVRTAIKDDGSVWFVLMDVCGALGTVNHNDVSGRVKAKYKDGVGITDPIGRQQRLTTVSESGLFSVIMESRSAKAEDFQDWVLEVVLPSIRKTGSYVQEVKPLTEIEMVERHLVVLKENAIIVAQRDAAQSLARIESTRANIAERGMVEIKRLADSLQPLAEEAAWNNTFDQVNEACIQISQAASQLLVSASVIWSHLLDNKWVTKHAVKGYQTTSKSRSKNWMRDIEFEPYRRYEHGPLLFGTTAHLTKSGMEQVRRELSFEGKVLAQKTFDQERYKKGNQ